MGRPHKPQWHAPRHCWKATISGRTRYFGREIPPTERPQVGGVPARAWEAMNALIATEEPAAVAPAQITGAGLCELYLQWAEGRKTEGRLSREHYINKEYHLGKFAEALGDRPAGTLAPDDMNEFIGAMLARHAPNYVANICASVSAAFNWAVRTKLLPTNPITGYESPTVPRAPERFAERKEAATFLALWRRRADRTTTAGRFARLTILLERVLIRTGARPGELCNLWWADIRWDAARTSAGHAYARAVVPPERWKSGEKTGRPRTIYLSPTLTRALRREMERTDRHSCNVFVHGRGRGGKGAGEPWESGSRLSKTILRARRAAIADLAEIANQIKAGQDVSPWERRWAGVSIHDEGHDRLTNYRWRHTAISTLLMLGVDVPTVAELTGTSPEMIHRVYGHLLDAHLATAAEKLAAGRKPSRSRPTGPA